MFVICYYTCACEAMYVGKTTQRLTERIKQNIPGRISTNRVKRTDSAILAHLKSNHSCIPGDNEHAIDRFRVLGNGRSQCHLNVLECAIVDYPPPPHASQEQPLMTSLIHRKPNNTRPETRRKTPTVRCNLIDFIVGVLFSTAFWSSATRALQNSIRKISYDTLSATT